ncbi:S8 family serine peptidase [bacterium]|nr:S8 family serine peptidase [bacterium]
MSMDRAKRGFARQLSLVLPLMAGMFLSLSAAGVLAQEKFQADVILVKLTPAAASQINIHLESGIVLTGLPSLDALNQQYRVRAMERVLRPGGKFEARHAQSGLTRYYKLRFDAGAEVEDLVRVYAGDGNLDAAQPNYRYELFDRREARRQVNFTPNDPQYPSQWHYNNTGQTGGTPDADIDAPEAWDTETGDPSVIVSDLDTGQDLDHPDLAANIWVNPGEIPGNNVDDDANGYIDDVNGWDFSSNDNNPDDYDGHGTHTAGTVAAVTNNGLGVAGVAFDSKIMPCKIFPNAFDDVIANAFTYGADNGSFVSTNSWGGGAQSNLIEDAIDYFLTTTNGVVVFAAGNSNSSDPAIGYPGSYPPVIAVAATDHNDVKASFSNYGTWVDISAPGVNVLSTLIGGYGYLNGTSMACPHVAGVAALVAAANPGLPGAQIRTQLESSADNIDATNPGFVGLLGSGRVNANRALSGGPFPNPPTNLQAAVSGNDAQLTWVDPTTNLDGSPINLAHVNVYRDGTEIAEVAGGVQSYSDLGLPDGFHSYFVTATNIEGEESGPSNLVSVLVGSFDVLIWKHPEVNEPNLARKASERNLTEAEVRALVSEPTSHLELAAALAAVGKSSLIVSDIASLDLSQFEAVFAVLGAFPNNHVIPNNSPEALAIENYVLNGGKMYMEGNDMWYYDPQFAGGHDFGPLFGITGLADGGGNFSTILGANFLAGYNFNYSCQTSFNDVIAPLAGAAVVHSNQSPAFNCGIAFDPGAYQTIGVSHQFGCLADGNSTKAQLLAAYLEHWGILEGVFADFVGAPTNGFAPLTVTFSDQSIGNITSWEWSFEGGTPATASGAGLHTVVYNSPGTFDVSLTVSGPEGSNTKTRTDYISVLIAPDITVTPTSFDVVLDPGGTVTHTLTIGNVGGSDLTFSISEAEGTAAALSKAIQIKPRWAGRPQDRQPPAVSSDSVKPHAAAGAGYADGHDPLRGAYPPPEGNPHPQATGVLLLHMGGDPSEIQGALSAYPDLSPVNTWDLGASGVPALGDLLAYDAVILMNNNAFPDPVGLGNVLADYVDAGGGVTTTLASFANGFQLAGRFMDEGYSPFDIGVGPVGGSNLGSFDPNHPVMQGVSTMFGDLLADVPLASGATSVAMWANGLQCVAVKGTVVAFNIFVASPGSWTGDVPLVLHNAVRFSSGGALTWLDEQPNAGTIPAGGSVEVSIIFDAAELVPGHYYAHLEISSNDPDEPVVTVSPIHLLVAADAVIWIPNDVLEPNLARKAMERSLPLQMVEQMAFQPTSHLELQAALAANGKSTHVVHSLTAADLAHADYLFAVLGVFPNNHVVRETDPEAAVLEQFLAAGGKVYLEGGDVWYYDPLFLSGHDFGESFFIDALEDGTNDLKTVIGSCVAGGMDFTYEGQNNFMDHLTPRNPACMIHSNEGPDYGCGVAYDSPSGYRTIGNAFQFGGLEDASLTGATKTALMAAYLNFFDTGLAGASATFEFPLAQGGWYLISLPVVPDDNRLAHLFPTALAAFGWDYASQSYSATTELQPTKAYWLALPAAATVTVRGQPVLTYSETYTQPGWDLIGSVMEISTLQAEPQSNVFAMFGYDPISATYQTRRSLAPNEGYWIAVSASESEPLYLTVGGVSGAPTLAGPAAVSWLRRFGATPPAPPFLIQTGRLGVIPTEYALLQNFPNPFNPETMIEYHLPEAGKVSLTVYSILGREVRKLVEAEQPAGVHRVRWEGTDSAGRKLDSGVYFYRLETKAFSQTRKVILLK